MRILSNLAVFLTSVVLLAACSSVKLDDKPVPVADHSRTSASTPQPETRTVETLNAAPADVDPLDAKNGLLAQRSIYFDYDSYTIQDQSRPVLEAHAKYLTSHRERKVLLQGNTDERGGREYNLALGQKRAEAVRKAMSLLGVSDAQMEAVSFGKEKPKAPGHDETAWAENRRVDIVYQ